MPINKYVVTPIPFAFIDFVMQSFLADRSHGKTYKRASVVHRASAPGEPPAPDTGTARRSVGWVRKGPLSWRFGSGSVVLLWMERGTRFIEKRPWIGPTIRCAGQKMRAAIRLGMRSG